MPILYRVLWLFSHYASKLIWSLRTEGEEFIPRKGAVIIASNHLSFFDPPLLWMQIPRKSHFLAKAELFRNWAFAALIKMFNAIPVNRERYDRKALRRCLKVLESDGCLVIFPEGSRGPEGTIREGNLGIGLLAHKARVPIVPVYLENTSRYIRSIFTRRRMRVRFGEPIDSGWLSGVAGSKQGYQIITGETMSRIRMLSGSVAAGGQNR